SSSARKRKAGRESPEFERKLIDDDDALCACCITEVNKQLLLHYSDNLYVTTPDRAPLLRHQLLIRSVAHTRSLLAAEQSVEQELDQLRGQICAMLDKMNLEPVFVEYNFKSQRWKRHFEIHCFPVPKDYAAEIRM